MSVSLTNTFTTRNSSGNETTIPDVEVLTDDNAIIILTSCQDSNHANFPIGAITRDGQSFTKIESYEPAGNVRVEAWKLASPNEGIADVVVEFDGSLGEVTACAYVVAGADIADLVDDYDGGSGSGFSPSVGLDTTVDNDMLLHVLCAEADITGVGAGQTTVVDYQDQGYENTLYSYKSAGASGSKVMSADMASGEAYAQVAIAVKAGEEAAPEQGSISLQTISVTNVKAATAQGNGNLIDSNSGAVTEMGFVVATTPTPTISDMKFTDEGVSEGVFTVDITGLSAGTIYYARTYSISAEGVVYGSTIQFTASARIKKVYLYRVYDGNTYIGSWSDEVISDPRFKASINGGGGELVIRLARPFDGFGEDIDVKLNNKVECYVINSNSPQGLLLFSGYISGYKPVIKKEEEFVEVTLFSYEAELARMVVRDGSGNTTLTYNSYDPANIMKDIINKLIDMGCSLGYTADSIELTGTTVSYTFNTNTGKECLDKIIELCPVGWFYRVDPDGYIYLSSKNTEADHEFMLGVHIEALETYRRVEDLVNRVLIVGGGDPPLYRIYENTSSQNLYGLYVEKIVDQRVTVAATAQTMANRRLDGNKDPEIRSTFTIVADDGPRPALGYNIESIKPGDTLKVKNIKTTQSSPSYWDIAEWDVDVWDQVISLTAADIIQILSVSYAPDSIVIEASSRLPQVSKRIEDINRNLEVSQTVNNPSIPT